MYALCERNVRLRRAMILTRIRKPSAMIFPRRPDPMSGFGGVSRPFCRLFGLWKTPSSINPFGGSPHPQNSTLPDQNPKKALFYADFSTPSPQMSTDFPTGCGELSPFLVEKFSEISDLHNAHHTTKASPHKARFRVIFKRIDSISFQIWVCRSDGRERNGVG